MSMDHQFTTILGFQIDSDKLFRLEKVGDEDFRRLRDEYRELFAGHLEKRAAFEEKDGDEYLPMGAIDLGKIRGQPITFEIIDSSGAPDYIAGIVLGDISNDDGYLTNSAPDVLIIKKDEIFAFLHHKLGLPVVPDSYKFHNVHQAY